MSIFAFSNTKERNHIILQPSRFYPAALCHPERSRAAAQSKDLKTRTERSLGYCRCSRSREAAQGRHPLRKTCPSRIIRRFRADGSAESLRERRRGPGDASPGAFLFRFTFSFSRRKEKVKKAFSFAPDPSTPLREALTASNARRRMPPFQGEATKAPGTVPCVLANTQNSPLCILLKTKKLKTKN